MNNIHKICNASNAIIMQILNNIFKIKLVKGTSKYVRLYEGMPLALRTYTVHF